MNKHFKVKWSTTSLAITLIVVGAIVALEVYYFWIEMNYDAKDWIIAGCLNAGLVGLLILLPLGIDITNQSISINRLIGKKTLDYAQIAEIGLSYTPMSLKVCGSGGLFGNLGWYKADGFGVYFSYVLDREQSFYVILKNGKRYMLSCTNPDEVIDAVRKHIGNPGSHV